MAQSLAHIIVTYGYVAVFLLVMLEDFGVPTPGETALIVASVAAAAGRLNIWGVVLAAFLGAVIGDNIGYAIGHFGGRRLVLAVGGKVGITHERLGKAEGFFERYGDIVVVGARFVEGLRQLNGIIAGTVGMHWARFLAYNALGAALWVGVWSAVGYYAGQNRKIIEFWLMRFSWLVLIVLIVAIALWVLVRRRRLGTPPAKAEGDAEDR